VLLTCPLPIAGSYVIGRPIAEWLATLDDGTTSLLTLLGYLLGLLVAVLLWGVALLPLRARAGFEPISEELARARREGFGNAVAREQAALKAREHSRDPRVRAGHHASMALVGALLSLGASGLSWALWQDGYLFVLPLAASIVCPPLALYHLAQWIRLRGSSARR
jgi:hypothetical protein